MSFPRRRLEILLRKRKAQRYLRRVGILHIKFGNSPVNALFLASKRSVWMTEKSKFVRDENFKHTPDIFIHFNSLT